MVIIFDGGQAAGSIEKVNMQIRAGFVALGAVLLTGCASYVTSSVTAFQDWNGSDRDRSYTFAHTPAQQNDLEQRAYEQLVDNELSTYGFRLTPAAQARYAVNIAYAQHETTGYTPQAAYGYGGWGGGGWGRGGYGWGYGPWWGPPPIVDVPYPAYASQLTIRIQERVSGREVYKVMARNVGDEGALPRVMPYLVRSALFDFPMPNGTTRNVRVNVDKRVGGANEVSVSAGSAVLPAASLAVPGAVAPPTTAAVPQ